MFQYVFFRYFGVLDLIVSVFLLGYKEAKEKEECQNEDL